MPNSRHADAVRFAIDSMGGTVALARALVEGGRQVDLEGLDQDANALCAAVMMLERDEARQLRPALETLLRQVSELTLEVARV